jgi:cell division protein ZapA
MLPLVRGIRVLKLLESAAKAWMVRINQAMTIRVRQLSNGFSEEVFMGQVTVQINERAYTVACGDGEEAHLKDLAAHINQHMSALAREVGQVGETRLLLMAALLVADELFEARQKTGMLETEIQALSNARSSAQERSREAEGLLADMLDTAARRIEDMAKRIDAA